MLQNVIQFYKTNWLFLVVLTAYVTALAYIHSPRWKTLVFSLPIPFSCIFLARGNKIDPTHLTGMVIVATYHWVVFLVVRKWRVPIIAGISLGVLVFLSLAVPVKPVAAKWEFGWTLLGVFFIWLAASLMYKPAKEPGHRSPVPWWLKFPLVFVIASMMLGAAEFVGGAAAFFPYAGVFTSYEMRHSLRTLAGQYTLNNIAALLMIPLMWWLEHNTSLSPLLVLLIGWCVLVPTIFCIYRFGFGRPKDPIAATE